MSSVLLIKTSSLGDVIHNTPVVSDLRRFDPHITIDWVVEEAFADIPKMHPAVGRVIPVAIRRWRHNLFNTQTHTQMRTFLHALRDQHYDKVIDTQGLLKSALISRLAKGSHYGYSKEAAREPLAAYFYSYQQNISRDLHAVVRNRQLVAACMDYTLKNTPPDYGLALDSTEPLWMACTQDSAYVVLLTATSRDDKLWPEEHWIKLGQALYQKGLCAVLPAGHTKERERAQRLAAQIPHAQVAPPSSLKELAALMNKAQYIVGVDTGLTHLAAALNRPVAAIYVATEPGLTGVYAGEKAINLGGRGKIPRVEDVLDALKHTKTM